MAGGRLRMPWGRHGGGFTGGGAARLTEAEIIRLRAELAAEHRRGLARLARLRRAEIIGDADPGAGSDVGTEQGV